jgi:hypothetical protein
MSQDPFEEFEFKPITEGLGFHKRKDPIREQPETSASTTLKMSSTPELNRPSIEMPITHSTVDSVLDSIKTKRKPLSFEEPKVTGSVKQVVSKVTPTQSKSWEPSLPDISAMILDGMLVLAGVLATLILTILTTHADLIAWSRQMGTFELIFSLYGLFGAISFIYTTTCRTFLGFTAGEWVTDQVITTNSGRGFKTLFAIMGRSILNIVTLFITLPILSNAIGQDLAGQISGARLSKEKL